MEQKRAANCCSQRIKSHDRNEVKIGKSGGLARLALRCSTHYKGTSVCLSVRLRAAAWVSRRETLTE